MRERQASHGARRARECEAFVAGAAGRLLHTATLLTAEPPDDNPRARRLLTLALAHTYAGWDRLHGEDPYDRARQYLATRFAREAWLRHGALGRASHRPTGLLAALTPQERLILVLRLYEGVAEEQAAALLGLPTDRVRAICDRAITALTRARAKHGRSAQERPAQGESMQGASTQGQTSRGRTAQGEAAYVRADGGKRVGRGGRT
ncbi:sigma factor-like helix-turn-helix DNA-binding protein [Streptomyces sp. NPDC086766]|uniref:sigma factor-like helix-turn-helix DNA-binding protein n=1 Tax=Streptomyces sp. NPDC086766 TaxID=3365754 RepID=UPI00381BF4AA